MAETPTPVEVFCCYSHADETWLQKLEIHLSLLKRQGLISFWHDRLITPGTNWVQAINQHLETASVILLLVSANFLASDYCYSVEMKRALERQEAGEARVVPILVRPVDWKDAPFAHLQALPTDAKPLTTWRNQETALADIAAGIRRAIEEVPMLSASAPRAALPPIWNIPYSRNPFFLGRETELVRVRHHLQGGQATALSQPQAISGLGGIGKTQLALEYAYRFHQDYQAVLWAGAESRETLVSSYIAIAMLLRLPEREAKEQDITVQAVKTWLQTHRGWLLILDNADDLALIPDFLPPSFGGHLLLTTRSVVTGRLAHRLEIETLLPEDGALFLLRRAALIAPDAQLSQATQEEQGLAVHISRELGGLPLALDQAGAYLEETGMDLAGYWHLYQQHRGNLLQQRGGLVADHPAPVATTWSLSFQKIEEKNPAAAELLRLCAFLSPDVIPEKLLTTGSSFFGPVLAPVAGDVFQLNQAIQALRAYSLVRRDPKGKDLSIHRLVQTVLQDSLEEGERQRWRTCAVLAVNASFPPPDYPNWPQCERFLSQALAMAELIERYHIVLTESGRLCYEIARYLMDRAQYSGVELLYQLAWRIREQLLGSEHPDTAKTLFELAYFYQTQGKYLQGEPLFLQVLAIYEQQFGPNHLKTAEGLVGLAHFYWRQGKYAQAEPLNLRALSIYEQKLGPAHLDTGRNLNDLAAVYRDQHKYAQAEPLYLRALSIYEQQLGAEHPNTAIVLINIASLYRKQGKYTEAEPLLRRCLSIREQQFGLDHPEVATCLNSLAKLYTVQGKYAQAEPLFLRALQIDEQRLGPEHLDMIYPLNGLANLYREQGKYVEAELLYQHALDIATQHLGQQALTTAEVMYDVAVFQEARGNREDARALYKQALAVCQQTLGDTHPKTKETRMRYVALLPIIDQDDGS